VQLTKERKPLIIDGTLKLY